MDASPSGNRGDASALDGALDGGLGSDSAMSMPILDDWGPAEAVTIQGYTGTSTEDLRISSQGYLLFDDHTNDSTAVQIFWATPGPDYKTFVFQGQVGGDLADSTAYLIDPSLDSTNHFFYTRAAAGTPKLYVGTWSSNAAAHQAAVTGSVALTGTTSGSQVNMDGFVSDEPDAPPGAAPAGLYTDLAVFNANHMPSSAQIAFAAPSPGPQGWNLQGSNQFANVNAVGQVLYNAIPSPDRTELFFTYADYAAGTLTLWESAWSNDGTFAQPVQILSAGTQSENGSLSPDEHHLYFHSFPNGNTNAASPSVVSR
jgi:hypothetical protein